MSKIPQQPISQTPPVSLPTPVSQGQQKAAPENQEQKNPSQPVPQAAKEQIEVQRLQRGHAQSSYSIPSNPHASSPNSYIPAIPGMEYVPGMGENFMNPNMGENLQHMGGWPQMPAMPTMPTLDGEMTMPNVQVPGMPNVYIPGTQNVEQTRRMYNMAVKSQDCYTLLHLAKQEFKQNTLPEVKASEILYQAFSAGVSRREGSQLLDLAKFEFQNNLLQLQTDEILMQAYSASMERKDGKTLHKIADFEAEVNLLPLKAAEIHELAHQIEQDYPYPLPPSYPYPHYK